MEDRYIGIVEVASSNLALSTHHLWLGFDYDAVLKERIAKNYRIYEIDSKIRKSRCKLESKLLSDAKRAGVRTPVLYDVDLSSKSILMERIDGVMLKDVIDEKLAFRVGCEISKLHDAGIIHGDITSSNIMLRDGEPVFIDFGLGRYSDLNEDKAVDLLVLKKSLQSIDYNKSIAYFNEVLKGYDDSKVAGLISDIERRGRYTH